MKSLDEISSIAFRRAGAVRVAVVKAADDHTLDSIVRAAHSGHVHPMLIDDEDATMRLLDGRLPEGSYEVLDVVDDSETAVLGVRLVREGYADVLMKGDLPSTTFLKPVVNRETGIRIGPVLSHVAVLESMGIGRLVAVTDGGMIAAPTAEILSPIVDHGVQVMRSLGIEQPKVALLSAAEQVIPNLTSAELQQAFAAHHACEEVVVEGPLSLDIALVPEIARKKGWTGQVQGNADVLVAPGLVTANVLVKSVVLFGGGRMAGIILGASVPIVLASRASSTDDKYFSLILASTLGTANGVGEYR
jgi:phosphate butyryltransferase